MKTISHRVLLFNLMLAMCLILTLPVSGSQSEQYAMKLHMGELETEIYETTVLPDVQFQDDELLGWSSSSTVTPTDLFLLPGVWYRPQSMVTPSAGTPEELFAHPRRKGQYAVFNPTAGTLPKGGNMVVYGAVSLDGNMEITVPDGSALQAPVGYTFGGWKTTDGTVYYGGEQLSIRTGKYVDLQAQWNIDSDAVQLCEGLYLLKDSDASCVITFGQTNADCIATALYQQSGQMQRVVAGEVEDGSVATTVQYDSNTIECKVFFLNSDNAPAREHISKLMEDISK